MILGKVYDCGIGVKTRNPKGRPTGFNSMIISFNTNEVIKLDEYVLLSLDDKLHSFKIHAININDTSFDIEAHEVGYYNLFHNMDNFDLRTLVSLDITLVEDEEVKKKIYKESCYC